jgi:hypothetical protein
MISGLTSFGVAIEKDAITTRKQVQMMMKVFTVKRFCLGYPIPVPVETAIYNSALVGDE